MLWILSADPLNPYKRGYCSQFIWLVSFEVTQRSPTLRDFGEDHRHRTETTDCAAREITQHTVIYRCVIHSQPTEIWCTGPECGLHAGETSFPSVIYYVNGTPFSCHENNRVLLS